MPIGALSNVMEQPTAFRFVSKGSGIEIQPTIITPSNPLVKAAGDSILPP
jgi:hypothetical protein